MTSLCVYKLKWKIASDTQIDRHLYIVTKGTKNKKIYKYNKEMSAPMLSAWKTSAFPDFSNTGCGSSLNEKKD